MGVRHARRICAAPGCANLAPCQAHPPRAPWRTSARASRQARGYGSEHVAMRRLVLAEESCCALCGRPGQDSDHADHVVPLSKGGSGDRVNYRRVCDSCHVLKSAREGSQARARIA